MRDLRTRLRTIHQSKRQRTPPRQRRRLTPLSTTQRRPRPTTPTQQSSIPTIPPQQPLQRPATPPPSPPQDRRRSGRPAKKRRGPLGRVLEQYRPRTAVDRELAQFKAHVHGLELAQTQPCTSQQANYLDEQLTVALARLRQLTRYQRNCASTSPPSPSPPAPEVVPIPSRPRCSHQEATNDSRRDRR